MKTKLRLAAVALLLSTINYPLSTCLAQGALTPPGAPGATMKTLAQIEPRTPISSLPYTITNPGSYYFTGNLASGFSGITISCGNVTIDLNGFTLQGLPLSGNGIFVSASYTNIVVRNGTIAGWGNYGLDSWSAAYPRNMLFENLTLSGNGSDGLTTEAGSIVRNCMAFGNGGRGFFSAGGELIDCSARNNTQSGFDVYYASLRHCLSEYNTLYGFGLNSSRLLDSDCQFNSNDGIYCQGTQNEIRRSRVVSNGGIGLHCASANNGNVIENCEVANNTGYGIYMAGTGTGGSLIRGNNFISNTSGGIIISENNDYIEDNHIVTPSGTEGIGVTSSGYTNIVVIKNVVVGGGANNYSNIGGANDFGPTGSAATATSPWANISH